MPRACLTLFGPALVAGLAHFSTAAAQDTGVILSPRVGNLVAGLFCAPPEGGRREAPETMAGWIHIPDEPVIMRAEGRIVPAVLGLGFGVTYTLTDPVTTGVQFTVTHPPMPPQGITAQRWQGAVAPGDADTVFFQFDTPNELQPGDWRFEATDLSGQPLFSVGFTVLPPADLPGLADLCRQGMMLSLIPAAPAAAG
ncbi:MAG: hypothetical protein Kow0013_30240 [Pararhodobacter sp.]